MSSSRFKILLSLVPLSLGGFTGHELISQEESYEDRALRVMLQDIRPELSRSKERVEAVLFELRRKETLDDQESALLEELEVIFEQMKNMESPEIQDFMSPI